MRTQDTVLCVQDGTDISFSTRPECEGLEVIGRNQTTAESKGEHAAGTQQWIEGLHDIEEAAETLPRKMRVICVMDREADIFALFAERDGLRRTDVIVRAKHDRNLGKKKARLFKAMRKGPSAGMMHLSVTRVSRRAKSGRVTNEGRPARNALMEVRYRKVILPPTKKKKKQEVVQDTEAPDSSETPVPPTDKDPQREPVQLWGGLPTFYASAKRVLLSGVFGIVPHGFGVLSAMRPV